MVSGLFYFPGLSLKIPHRNPANSMTARKGKSSGNLKQGRMGVFLSHNTTAQNC
jgi:hypothetical protein